MRSRDRRAAPSAVRKIQPVVEPDFSVSARTPVKIGKIRAAPKRHVLAIVHFAAVGQRIGSGAPAQVRTLLEQAGL